MGNICGGSGKAHVSGDCRPPSSGEILSASRTRFLSSSLFAIL